MIAFFLLSVALLGFWTGWRSQVCHKWSYGEEIWISRLFVPALAFMVWLALFIFALGKGWV